MVPEPGARDLHAAIYDPPTNGLDSNGRTIIPAWSEISTTDGPPSRRGSHTSVYNNNLASNRMIVFAEQTECVDSCVDLNDVWVLTDANGMIPRGGACFRCDLNGGRKTSPR